MQHEAKTYNCEECDFKFKTKTLLTKHKEIQHEAKTYKCEECDFKSKTKTLLTRHKEMHPEAKTYKCEQCDSQSTSKHILDFRQEPAKIDPTPPDGSSVHARCQHHAPASRHMGV